MANSEKEKMTARDRQIAKIDQLKARLQNEEAKLRSQARKERNAQLIALGVFWEICSRSQTREQLEEMREAMREVLKGRTLDLALAAVDRIEKENLKLASKKEISPEPPSQLPDAAAREKNQGSA